MRLRRGVRDLAALALTGCAVFTAGRLYLEHGSEHLRRVASADMGYHVDFQTFWRSAVALLHGADIYQTGAEYPDLNPPVATVLLAPLGMFDQLTGFRLWLLCTVVLMVGCLAAVAHELRTSPGWVVGVAVAVLVSGPLLGTLALGQIYVLLAALLTACWLADRHGWPIVAGAALGLVIAVKPLLLPLLALPALRRQWLQFGAGAVGTVVASAVGVALAGVVLGARLVALHSRQRSRHLLR